VAAFRIAFQWTVLLTGFLLARRNLRLGRGDLRGAFRLAGFAFATTLLGWLMGSRLSLPSLEAGLNRQFAEALLQGLIFWTFHIGFEPPVRRLWPKRIISWNRLLAGKLRDPLVGRDVLVGCLLGLGKAVLRYSRELPNTIAFERPLSGAGTLSANLQGPVQYLPAALFSGLFLSLQFMLLFLVMRILLRREMLVVVTLWILLTLESALQGPPTLQNFACSGLTAILVVIAYMRFGPLAGSTVWVVYLLCLVYPLTLNAAAWYAGNSLFALLVIVSLVLYGFATSVAGQPWFARSGVLDD